MEHPSEPRKQEGTTDNTELHEILQRLNNTYGNGQPVTPLPSQARLSTPDHVNNTTPSENGAPPQPDLVLPPPETQTIPDKDDRDTTPQTTSSDTVVSSEPNPVIPPATR